MPPRYRLLDLTSSGRGASAEKRWDYARFYLGVNVLARQHRDRSTGFSGAPQVDPSGHGRRDFPEGRQAPAAGPGPERRGTFPARRRLITTGAATAPPSEADGAGRRRRQALDQVLQLRDHP